MILSMLSLGTLFALAFAITSLSFEFEAGSGPPSRTITAISLPILVKTLALWLSVFSFFLLVIVLFCVGHHILFRLLCFGPKEFLEGL